MNAIDPHSRDIPFEALLATRPRRAIDAVIEGLRVDEPKDEDCESALDRLAQAVYADRGLEGLTGNAVFADLFRGRLSKADRRLVAACLLRALAADRDCISETIMRKHAARLFAEILPDRLFLRMGLDRGADQASKQLELPHIEQKAVIAMQSVISGYTQLEDMRRFRQDFMRTLQDPAVSAVVLPFLPGDLIRPGFNRVARHVEEATSLQAPADLERYSTAVQSVLDFRESAAAQDTLYSDRFLVLLADRFQESLAEAFGASPLSRPARLRLRPTDKKYPLHREGEEVDLYFEVANLADGPAFDVALALDSSAALAPIETSDLILGEVPAEGKRITVPAIVRIGAQQTELSYLLEWANADGQRQSELSEVQVIAQQADIDWDALAGDNPYPNKAVSDPERLAGRRTLLQQLEGLATGPEVGSTRISGQKRVGKSSLVRSLKAKLERLPGAPLLVCYVDVNKLGIEDDRAKEAVATTMRAVSREILRTSARLSDLHTPSYEDSLEDFAEFLDKVREREPDKSILVILDEFDELPNAAFERGGPGDPMFRAFKSLSSEGECGFFLVGGERLELALSRQGDRLNAFRETHVDYLGEEDVDDFEELVVRPVARYLEFAPEALLDLRKRTGGHPFFTLLVCRQVLERARERRDAHITLREIGDAYNGALQSAPASVFAHVWFDHIFDESEAVNVIADRRIRLLLSWAACIRRRLPPTEEGIIEAAAEYELPRAACREELRSLVNRKLLRVHDGTYRGTSRFFEDWLGEFGSEKIRAEQPQLKSLERYVRKEDQQRIRSHELIDLTRAWPTFRSVTVGPEDVRAWLEQFGDTANQRHALALLQNLNFFPARRVKELIQDLHRHARRDTRENLDSRAALKQRKRRDFAVAYMEPDGKSAQAMAQQYADANNISRECVAGLDRIGGVMDRHPVQRVVIVDDFVGTGGTASRRVTDGAELILRASERSGHRVLLSVVCGFEEGVFAVQAKVGQLELPIDVVVGEELDEADKCFHESSIAFVDDAERLVTKRMVEEIGKEMGSDEPLGTGDLEALVVFEHNCPNNSLPVLWKASDRVPWKPLFPRITTI